MFKLITRGITANLGRLALTLVAVVLGVSAVSGSFVLSDSLRAVFSGVIEESLQGVDAEVRAVPPELESQFSAPVEPRFDQAVVADIEALDEVASASGILQVFEQIYAVGPDGEILRSQGPPVIAVSWDGNASIGEIVEGAAPVGDQVVLDTAQATAGGFALGDQVPVAIPTGETKEYELVGLYEFGAASGGAYFILMDLPTLQAATGSEGEINAVNVAAASGVSSAELTDALNASLPAELQAVSRDDLAAEGEEDFGTFIDLFGNILLGFAFVILFVSIFIIYNTFVILVGQRTRQLGLLRSIGASSGQVRWMVLIEAFIIGLIASIVGLFGGVGVAELLKWVFSQGGAAFPDGPTRLLGRTIAVVFAVGVGVTVLSAMVPAIKASRIAPLEAIRDGGTTTRSLRFRLISGVLVLLPGLIAFSLAMTGQIASTSGTFTMLGIGGALIFIGVAMLSALFAGSVASLLGRPVEAVKGITGRLARDNASRNPQRTAATATALMIGLALITGVGVLTSSVVATFDKVLEDAFSSDLIVYAPPQGQPFSPTLLGPLADVEGVEAVSGYSIVPIAVNGEQVDARALNTETGTSVINPGIIDGSFDLGETGVALYDKTATEEGYELGDQVAFTFPDGETLDLTIQALYDNAAAVDGVSWLFDRSVSSAHVIQDEVVWMGVTLSGDSDPDSESFQATRARVEDAIAAQPQLETRDNGEFRDQLVDQINQLQLLIFGLLAMCIVVAFFGILNTMVLSILERTREIGLLRAVGTTRAQMRTSIRWEAVIVSLFGSLLGVIMGVALGWSAVTAIPDEFISIVAVPWTQIVIFLVVGALIGVLAAWLPGRRAARLDVLQAISYE